ncbi:unnamed protein product [Bursaphelenchus xylophilus]|uniref:(pine wood nematode) hypothetical protein n=1 Tax=Bursaphelenchus xylophilus TaxID=6326 RepID=A0A1I7SBR1_BURXY|nr:unnamed protein product [Bursaphelenchus xylophilus]CAG9111194.1 unnamed protein product [Bursaphelenchus xylophilus]
MATILILLALCGGLYGQRVTPEQQLKAETALMAKRMNRNVEPCENFTAFAAGNIGLASTRAVNIIESAKVLSRVHFPTQASSLKTVKDVYKACKADNSTLIPPLFNTTEIKNVTDELAKYAATSGADLTSFIKVYGNVLRVLFNYGHDYFSEKLFLSGIRLPSVIAKGNLTIPKENECKTLAGVALCANLTKTVFGIDGCTNATIYIPKNAAERKNYSTALVQFLKNNVTAQNLTSCEEYIWKVYPIYYKKLLIDFYFPSERSLKRFHDKILAYATGFNIGIKEFVSFAELSNSTVDEINKRTKTVLFHFLSHPVFDDTEFAKSFGTLNSTEPYYNRHINNIKPLLEWNLKKNLTRFATFSLEEHNHVVFEADRTEIHFGWPALSYPNFYEGLPTQLVFPNFVVPFKTLLANEITYAAFVKWVGINEAVTQIPAPFGPELNHEHLYFIKLAQLIAENNDNGVEDVWNIIRCFPAFSDTFKCTHGNDFHYDRRDCQGKSESLFPSYEIA